MKNEEEIMAVLRNEFHFLELKRFEIVSNFVTGMIKISEIEKFKERLFKFRDTLYKTAVSDKYIYEIAKMKSMVQHFNTEVLEDENILDMAYKNEN